MSRGRFWLEVTRLMDAIINVLKRGWLLLYFHWGNLLWCRVRYCTESTNIHIKQWKVGYDREQVSVASRAQHAIGASWLHQSIWQKSCLFYNASWRRRSKHMSLSRVKSNWACNKKRCILRDTTQGLRTRQGRRLLRSIIQALMCYRKRLEACALSSGSD